jgi:hypothetical protein
MPLSCRPSFAHPAAAGARGTANRPASSEPLFLMGYTADSGMARVWQIPIPETHRTQKVTLSRGFSAGELNVSNRGGKREWVCSWEQYHREPQTQLQRRTSPCGMRSGERKSRRGFTRGNVSSVGGGSGRGTRTGFAVSSATRPRPGNSDGSSRSSTVRQDNTPAERQRASRVCRPGRMP